MLADWLGHVGHGSLLLARSLSNLTILNVKNSGPGFLLQRLETSFGLCGSPLNWFRSYLCDRSQMVVLGDTRSSWVPVQFGVPQGSVLGPLLYILFTADISRLFAKYSASGHLYADDVRRTGLVYSLISFYCEWRRI